MTLGKTATLRALATATFLILLVPSLHAASAGDDDEKKKAKKAKNPAAAVDAASEDAVDDVLEEAAARPAEAEPEVQAGPGNLKILLDDHPDLDGDDDEDEDDDLKKEDVVLFGQGRIIEEGEVVTGDVVVVGGDLTINGTVMGDAVCVGGKLTAGPGAVIRGDLVNVGGKADIDPDAKVKGSRVNVVGVPLGIFKHFKHFESGDFDKVHEKATFGGRIAKFVSEIVFLLFMLFVALLMTVFMPRQLGRIDDHLAGDFPRSALLGVAVMILLPLVVVILAVTIVGIPLIPLLLLAVAVTCLMGYIAFSRVLGRKLVGDRHVMLQILVGLVLLQAASILGDLIAIPGGSFSLVAGIFNAIGAIIFIGANFLGLGAVVYSRWGKRTLAQTQASRSPNGNGSHAPAPTPPPAPSNG
jgi:hypothetical protein